MTAYLLPGLLGLLTGLLLRWNGFVRPAQTRLALGLKRSYALRSALTALGWSMTGTALLCWLAVIDVDQIEVLPLSAGALLGGLLFGAAAELCGFTPTTAFAGLAAAPPETFCVLAGCFAGARLLPVLDGLLASLHTAAPYTAATLFQVTLDEPWLLEGSFLGQGCAGLLLAAAAMCIPSPKPILLTDVSEAKEVPTIDDAPQENPQTSADSEDTGPSDRPELPPADPEETSAIPDNDPAAAETEALDKSSSDSAGHQALPETSVSEDNPPAAGTTFVALLEGEEPLIVDTAPDEDAPKHTDSPDEQEETAPAEKSK